MVLGKAIVNVFIWGWGNLQVEENGSTVKGADKNKISTYQLFKIFVIASELLIKGICKSSAEIFFLSESDLGEIVMNWELLEKWN